MTTDYSWTQIKPKPTNIPEGFTVSRCGKCGGNGMYVMAVVNGQPWSATGTDCYMCSGAGWIIKRKPIKKSTCPRCGCKFPKEELSSHKVYRMVDHDVKAVDCE